MPRSCHRCGSPVEPESRHKQLCVSCGFLFVRNRTAQGGPSLDWLPISTAPTNIHVLVACKSGYVRTDGLWEYRVARYQDTSGRGTNWLAINGSHLSEEGLHPSFWSPLPKPPPQDEKLEELKMWLRTSMDDTAADKAIELLEALTRKQ